MTRNAFVLLAVAVVASWVTWQFVPTGARGPRAQGALQQEPNAEPAPEPRAVATVQNAASSPSKKQQAPEVTADILAAAQALETTTAADEDPNRPSLRNGEPMQWETSAFRYYHDDFAQSPPDDEQTSLAEEFFEDAIAKYKIQPTFREFTCKKDICRYRFAFRTTSEMHALDLIPRDPNWTIAHSPPEPTKEGVGIVIYSKRKPPGSETAPTAEVEGPLDRE